MIRRARELRDELRQRRTVRDFSTAPVPLAVIEDAIATAGSAPSGANQQPWTFVLVSEPELKARIRAEAEQEEQRSYDGRMSDEWLAALEHLGTDWRKPHLSDAPYLIVVFEQVWGYQPGEDGTPRRVKHYYAEPSVGIAVGFLLAALHHAGLATLTHTPSPMGFLRTALARPDNERAFMIIPVGYPSDGAVVPVITKKSLEDILVRR